MEENKAIFDFESAESKLKNIYSMQVKSVHDLKNDFNSMLQNFLENNDNHLKKLQAEFKNQLFLYKMEISHQQFNFERETTKLRWACERKIKDNEEAHMKDMEKLKNFYEKDDLSRESSKYPFTDVEFKCSKNSLYDNKQVLELIESRRQCFKEYDTLSRNYNDLLRRFDNQLKLNKAAETKIKHQAKRITELETIHSLSQIGVSALKKFGSSEQLFCKKIYESSPKIRSVSPFEPSKGVFFDNGFYKAIRSVSPFEPSKGVFFDNGFYKANGKNKK